MSGKKAAEEMKRIVGMAPYGTCEYWRNAAKVLSQYAYDYPNIPEDIGIKLEALSENDDPETRTIAKNASIGIPYKEDDEDFDWRAEFL